MDQSHPLLHIIPLSPQFCAEDKTPLQVPQLDRISAKAHGGDDALLTKWATGKWHLTNDALGLLASAKGERIQSKRHVNFSSVSPTILSSPSGKLATVIEKAMYLVSNEDVKSGSGSRHARAAIDITTKNRLGRAVRLRNIQRRLGVCL